MKNSLKRFFVASAFVATAGVSYYLGVSTSAAVDQNGLDAVTTDVGEPKVLYWRAPMDPAETYDSPGKSRMGMDLVPVYEDIPGIGAGDDDESGVIKINPRALQKVNFRTAVASIDRLNPSIRTTGRFVMDETGRTSISLKTDGWIQKLHVNFDGAMVEKGQPVLDLYSPALVATQEEFLVALENLNRLRGTDSEAGARRLVDATRRRLDFWDVSEEQIRKISESMIATPNLTFYAPHAGEVMHLNVAEGQYVPAGHRLMDVVDVSKIWLVVDINEEDLSRISVGSKARVEVRSEPGRQFEGNVDYIYHMMNDELRTARARIMLPGRHGGPLKPGMYATAFLNASDNAAELLIPESALIRTGDRNLAVVDLGSGRFRLQLVRPGLSAGDRIQILSGLEAGDEVVVNAQFLIDSEASLTGVIASMDGSRK